MFMGWVSQLCFFIPGAAGCCCVPADRKSSFLQQPGYLTRLATWGGAVAAAKSCSGDLAFENEIKFFCPPLRQWNLVFIALRLSQDCLVLLCLVSW